jgi:heat shock protein HslJ
MADHTDNPGHDRDAGRPGDAGRSDEVLDELLRQAGARWRDGNTRPAAVDLAAVTAPAPADGTAPAAGAAAVGEPGPDDSRSGTAAPLPLLSDPGRTAGPGRRRSRTGRTALAALAAAAAVAGLTVGLLQLAGGSSGGHRPAADGPASSAPASAAPDDAAGAAVIGPHWRLVGLAGPNGTVVPAAAPADFRVTGSGLAFSDGCNSGGGQATVTGSTISFAELVRTTMACAARQPGQSEQEQLIDSVISGSVHWAVRAGVLTLSKPGVGTLSYTAAAATRAVDPDSVFTGTWYLRTVQPGDNLAQPDGAAVSAPAGARVDWNGGPSYDGCNSFVVSGYRYVGDALTISGVHYVPPAKPCPQGYSEWTQILADAAHWTVTGGRLSIADAHGGVLTFTRAAAGGPEAASSSGAASRP